MSAESLDSTEATPVDEKALDPKAEFHTKWWGFEVHLNQPAIDLVQGFRDVIEEIVSPFLPTPLSEIVSAACLLQREWIKAVSKGHGCKLVSPWFSPTMLIPVPLNAPTSDTNLWWTVFEPDKGWSTDEVFPAHGSAGHPALAVFKDKLYCVHRGYGGNDADLWWTVHTPDRGWSPDNKFPAHGSASGPALAVFQDKLYCAHRGNTDANLWITSFNGTSWSADRQIPSTGSSTGPALAVFDGKLYMVFKGNSDTNIWWTSTSNGTNWTSPQAIPNHGTGANPALAVFNGKLYCVTRGTTDADLWWTTFNGSTWTTPRKFPAHGSREGVGLAVFKGKLYCVHRGNTDQSLWWTAFDGNNWSADTRLPAHTSGASPAMAVYRDQNGTRDQLMCVHRGFGERFVSQDGEVLTAEAPGDHSQDPAPQR
ncbi:sialidase family protein [Streptomyces sp. NPDC051578]|uniref:sialidase family protein n=1 Tax=Streptomyces sp. NPDC051578 TaxID=3365662 RepID=UPI0037A41D29